MAVATALRLPLHWALCDSIISKVEAMKVIFNRVTTPAQVENVVQLADIIWTQHYSPIIGQDQVRYMLNNFHSVNTISNEIDDEKNHYYLIFKNEVAVGYIGMKLGIGSLFLSKLYILARERGSGIGNQSIAFIREFSISNQLEKIILTVNKNNTNSISAYKKIGFKITGEICIDIGAGYVMDDYQMELGVQLGTNA